MTNDVNRAAASPSRCPSPALHGVVLVSLELLDRYSLDPLAVDLHW